MKNRKTTLKKSIVLNSLVTILIPILLFGVISMNIYSKNYSKSVAIKNKIISNTLSNEFTTLLENPLSVLYLIDNFITQHNTGSSFDLTDHINDFINTLSNSFDYVTNVEVIDYSGVVTNSGNDPASTIDSNRSGESFFKYFRENDTDIYWSSPYISATTKNLTFYIAIKTSTNGFILAYIDLNKLSKASLDFANTFTESLEIAITDSHGIYVSHSDISNVYLRLFEPNFVTIKDIAHNDSSQYTILNYDDGKYVVTATLLPSANWYVIVYQPYNTTFSFIFQLIIILSLVILIGILLAISYAFFYAGRIDTFIKSFDNQISSAVSMGYQSSLPEFSYEDFNKIGKNFNKMITSINERDHKLYDMAYKDQLTKLGNRISLIEFLAKFDTSNPNSYLTCVQFDLDDFRLINDLYGYDTGDQLLIYIANELRLIYKHQHIHIYRSAGDEFVLIFNDYIEYYALKESIRELRLKLKNGIFPNTNINATMSIGISYYPEHTRQPDKLLQLSNMALIESKLNGKNNIMTYHPMIKEKIQAESNMKNLLEIALDRNLFELHYQPQINAKTNNIYGFEALLRLRDSNNNLISPNDFIPIAEKSGLILKIGEYVIEESINVLLKLNKKYNAHYHMSINISPVQMQSPTFTRRIIDIVAKSNVDRSLIDFEITESVFIDSYTKAFDTLTTLNNQGLHFSLDDFGTGYSSLSYLSALPFDTLKIDRLFIAGIENSHTKRELLKSIISLGHNLDLFIVAEGVEGLDQMYIVKNYGCDIIQGFLYSKPLTYSQLILYIDHTNNNTNYEL